MQMRDNLTLFDDSVPDDRISAVLDTIGLADWLRVLPSGLETPLGTGGAGLSAGQSQLHVSGLARRRRVERPGVLVTVDEEKPNAAAGVACRGETAQQKRALAANDDREASLGRGASHGHSDRETHPGQGAGRANARDVVPCWSGRLEHDIAVVNHVVAGDSERVEKVSGAEDARRAGLSRGQSGGAVRDRNEGDAHNSL